MVTYWVVRCCGACILWSELEQDFGILTLRGYLSYMGYTHTHTHTHTHEPTVKDTHTHTLVLVYLFWWIRKHSLSGDSTLQGHVANTQARPIHSLHKVPNTNMQHIVWVSHNSCCTIEKLLTPSSILHTFSGKTHCKLHLVMAQHAKWVKVHRFMSPVQILLFTLVGCERFLSQSGSTLRWQCWT